MHTARQCVELERDTCTPALASLLVYCVPQGHATTVSRHCTKTRVQTHGFLPLQGPWGGAPRCRDRRPSGGHRSHARRHRGRAMRAHSAAAASAPPGSTAPPAGCPLRPAHALPLTPRPTRPAHPTRLLNDTNARCSSRTEDVTSGRPPPRPLRRGSRRRLPFGAHACTDGTIGGSNQVTACAVTCSADVAGSSRPRRSGRTLMHTDAARKVPQWDCGAACMWCMHAAERHLGEPEVAEVLVDVDDAGVDAEGGVVVLDGAGDVAELREDGREVVACVCKVGLQLERRLHGTGGA